jgi:hypothetical protein
VTCFELLQGTAYIEHCSLHKGSVCQLNCGLVSDHSMFSARYTGIRWPGGGMALSGRG